MFKLASIVTILSLLAAASAFAAPPVSEILTTTPEATASSLESVSLLAMNELAQLTGGAPDWVVGSCVAIGGFTGGRSLVKQVAKQLGKRVVIGTLCPWCGVGMTVAAIGCAFL